jgi:hypothetical protein
MITVEKLSDTRSLQEWWVVKRDGKVVSVAYDNQAEAEELGNIFKRVAS